MATAEAHRRSRYRVSPAVFWGMLDRQGGKCAICRHPFSPWEPYRKPHLDHRHGSRWVRGLLDAPCNMGLGLFEDHTTRLLAAAEVLESGRYRRPFRYDRRGLTACEVCGGKRGPICLRCGRGMARFGDDPARLRAAAEYLLRSRRSPADQEQPYVPTPERWRSGADDQARNDRWEAMVEARSRWPMPAAEPVKRSFWARLLRIPDVEDT